MIWVLAGEPERLREGWIEPEGGRKGRERN
jgi:hypothetical protein